MFGLDTVTYSELHGSQSRVLVMGHEHPVNRLSLPVRQDLIDDHFPDSKNTQGSVIMPKYSNYLRNQQHWARGITARIPVDILHLHSDQQDKGRLIILIKQLSNQKIYIYILFIAANIHLC